MLSQFMKLSLDMHKYAQKHQSALKTEKKYVIQAKLTISVHELDTWRRNYSLIPKQFAENLRYGH